MPSINPLTKYADGFVGGFAAPEDDDSLLHAELFSADQMEQHGRALAAMHVLGRSTRDHLLQRLDANEKVLIAARDLLTGSLKSGGRVPPAAEWLLDNFYLIEEQIQTAQRHLPKNYSRQLPRLAEGKSRQLPRVYDLALAVISHSDGRVREDILRRFIAAYQELTSLKLGELWAIPIMLRLALVENLRRVSARLISVRDQIDQAQQWADRMIETAASEPRDLVLVLADMARSKPKMQSSFVAELTRRLQGHAPALSLPLTWIEQHLAESSLTIEQLVLAESQQQAVDQLAISNSIASLRLLGAIDWRLFVEAMSGVEHILRKDPAGVYAAMDFATRDRYRHVVANLAHYSARSEVDIARAALTLADRGSGENEEFARHIGYYLVDAGYRQLEVEVDARVPLRTLMQRKLTSMPLPLYLGGILLLTIAFAGSLMAQLPPPGSIARFLMAFVMLLAASQLAATLMNWLATLLAAPDLLPRMDYSKGIPESTRALVIVPTLLTSARGVASLIEDLEIRFLGNRDRHLYFGLLTDWPDAQAEVLPTDAALLDQASTGIAGLNAKYADAEGQPANIFFLFHRPRRWNAAEKVWMAYERKRGKQAALNNLLRGAGRDEFAHIVGDINLLQGLPYVITLDTDTQLPRDAARQLIATLAHPLNRARYDTGRQLIVGGYGILQPSIAATLDDALRSRYAQLSGSEPGIDPYTRSVSDVYQDLYNEGSFIGKGIYDVDAFEYALKGRFPENRILSHDLLEGCYARSGLVSDIRLYEEQPARYEADVNRQRRWIRGDWQIARWLLPRVPGMEGSQPNPLSGLSQWKILDNLRRSLVPAALVAVLLFAWFATGQALVWTLAIAGSFVLQPVLAAVLCLVNSRADIGMRQTLRKMRRGLGESLALNAFRFACLPYEAWYSLDAIARVIWRLLVSRRGLLEWAPQALEAHKPVGGLSGSYRRMWIAPTLALATALLLAYLDSGALVPALPVLCLWLAAPTLAWAISQPLPPAVDGVNAAQRLFLRRSARKTWAFFERFHAAADNWLPPDNYQEAPGPILAHRTSPTNIGLALLANLSAHDFGYLSRGALLSRIDATFGTLGELERYQGHFYNWYDTLSLQPLPPRYVSAVDSGNLAAHLLVLREGVLALPDATLADQRIFRGLVDTLAVPRHTLATMASAPTDALHALEQLQAQLARFVDEAPTDLHAVLQALGLLMATAHETANALQIKALAPTHEDTGEWLATFARQCREHIDDLLFLAPWLALAPPPAAIAQALPRLVEPGASILTLRELAEDRFDPELAADAAIPAELSAGQSAWLHDWREARRLGAERAALRIASCEQLARQADGFADMDYKFLYDRTRHLLAIGYNADEFRRDASFYDLLASEARLCSFVAIAQGKLPQESWFALGRLLTNASGDPVLVSWSGSMFEYLMPLLVMPSYESTLLDRTCRAAVAHQIAYGRQRGVPWGISESGYNLTDAHLNYQYHAFGVPGLGLQRGLGNNLVISPYASALALLVAPEAAAHNLQQLSTSGFEGPYGFYEAIDYTPARLGRAQSHVVVRSYMAHHQGMTLLALAHQLCDAPMQRRFSAVPLFQATLLLLQERIPATSLFYNPPPEDRVENVVPIAGEPPVNVPFGAVTPVPEVQLLSNGRYHVMLTNAGGGYSRWKDAAITRWREDTTRDHWGSFIYVRDADSGEFWSTTYQPTLKKATSYEALFNTGRAEYRRQDHDIETYTEIVISPEDDVELRRVRLTNRSSTVRTLDVTSYAEVVLNAPAADALQPAFSNLFVQTRILRERQAILCTRRPRSAVEHTPSLFHLLRADGIDTAFISYETDRMRFIGRGQTLEAPAAIQEAADLSGSEGSVLDPIVAIRCRVTLEPHKSVTLDFVYGIGADSDVCSGLIDKYHDRHLTERAFDMAYPHAAVTLRQINASESDAQLYRRLAGHMLYARQTLRADPSVLLQNRRGQSGLWGYSISGDLPILLLKISSVSHVDIAQQLIQCHAYWRLKGLMTDLVIWNEDHVGYRQVLLDRIMALIATGPDAHAIDRPGGIFVRSGEQISSEDRILLQTVARAIISDDQGTLAEQLKRREAPERRVARLTTIRPHRAELPVTTMPEATGLVLTNGLGGFTEDGREYIITTVPGQMTPLPWVNVLANPDFGSIVAETGLGYTWSENAHEFRLTPWSNDAVGATGGEAFYLRDEESGHFWSPTPLPARGNQVYRTRHGFGYSVFEYRSGGGLVSELSVYVDLEMPVKFFVLKVRNESGRPRKLSATGYVEWVLGDLRTKSAMHIVTEIDAASGALFARNAYHSEFGSRVGFFDVDDASRTLTGDRSEFFGRNGDLACPDAMTRARLSGRLGAGFDPCGAIQVPFELAVGQERQIIFRLGAGRSREHARELARRLRTPGSARAALEKVHHYWRHTLDAVRIETPDPALNVLTNGWLVYQTLACRFWARSGFYQSGGAYGFRDQLQDAMALVHARPEVLRQQLLRSAAHQYLEGDVQHWWHPPADRGVRTRCSDDYLWLPLAASRYVMVTGDAALLSEPVPFITGRALTAEEESYYDLPVPANESASLYRHCVLAIEHGLRFGERGLPLMGSGDWNDGMNLVGIHGKGESVWLGFFLYRVLKDFAAIARMREDVEFAERCQTEAETLRENLSAHAWDGQWYKRAWFDDGTPLGSSTNDECAIDSIAQSWSVLSGAGEPERSRIALESLDKHLVRRDAKLIQLLDPPFDKSRLDPGYIKGYVPGVRENGGQYTHAAIWAAMAFAVSGNSERAWELLSMINPVNHGTDPATRDVYKVEPYVVAADVYGVAPHTGRGGWSWYTGSAGWMYRLIIEALLGLQREGKRLLLNPSMPAAWPSCVLHYRFGESVYHIRVRRMASTAPQVTLDGSTQNDKAIELVDDGREHEVEVTIP